MLKKDEPRKVELISLVDVVFLLLIFFIVTLVFGVDSHKKGKNSGVGEGTIIDANLPVVDNEYLKKAEDSLSICITAEDDGIKSYILDADYPDLPAMNRMRSRLQELRSLPALSADMVMEGRRLFLAWHRHVVENNIHGDGINITQWNNTGYCSISWYILPNVANHNDFIVRINQTIGNYVQSVPPGEQLKFAIVADKSVPYRLVYDVMEVLDNYHIKVVDVRMTKKGR